MAQSRHEVRPEPEEAESNSGRRPGDTVNWNPWGTAHSNEEPSVTPDPTGAVRRKRKRRTVSRLALVAAACAAVAVVVMVVPIMARETRAVHHQPGGSLAFGAVASLNAQAPAGTALTTSPKPIGRTGSAAAPTPGNGARQNASGGSTSPTVTSRDRGQSPTGGGPGSGGGGGSGGSPRPTATAPTAQPLVVRPPERLESGMSVQTSQVKLIMQAGGALAVVSPGGTVLWRSPTSGSGNYAAFQDDGNLVVYTADGSPQWNSATAGYPDAVLTVHVNGAMTITNGSAVLWSNQR